MTDKQRSNRWAGAVGLLAVLGSVASLALVLGAPSGSAASGTPTPIPTSVPASVPASLPASAPTSLPSSPDGYAPVLSLAPDRGVPGTAVVVSGTDFGRCADSGVSLYWDGVLSENVPVDTAGAFSVRLAVPADASVGQHKAGAGCGDAAYDSKYFTVVSPASPAPAVTDPRSTGTPVPGQPAQSNQPGVTDSSSLPAGAAVPTSGGGSSAGAGLVAGSAVLGALLLGGLVYAARFRRGPHWAREHVRPVPRPGAAWVGVQETGGAAGPSWTVRVEPRSDPGEQTIEEVE